MAKPLRGEEILACIHRVALSRGEPFEFNRPPTSDEMARRQRDAASHRLTVLNEIRRLHPLALTPTSIDETLTSLQSGVELVLQPRLPQDIEGLRQATAHALVRVGRVDATYSYAPIIIKNNEITESATTRRILSGTLELLAPSDAVYRDGLGVRSTPTVTRNGIVLAHVTQLLATLGFGDPAARVAVVDRHAQLWWFDLAGTNYPRFNLSTYQHLYEQRVEIIRRHDRWRVEGGPFPTTAYWHKECLDCVYQWHCATDLEKVDDVSLTRFTNFSQQLLLREHGVTTRRQLAALNPQRARQARAKVLTPDDPIEIEDHLGRSIELLDDLIYRARAHLRGTSLRIVEPDAVGCPTADVEVDIDMESYGDATYLWGAFVSSDQPHDGIESGYQSFAEWGPLTLEAEAENFAKFWAWLSTIRSRCQAQGLTFAAYCFWAQAEDGAMNRAVSTPLAGVAIADELRAFRSSTPSEWIDLHAQAKRQLQTEGPLGLKQLAQAAGFHWRDLNPSGEASMLWYEIASSDSDQAPSSRQRILEYNEDDCKATKALRDWLNGPARLLAHRDDNF